MKKYLPLLACALTVATPAFATTVDFTSTPSGTLAEGTNVGGIVFSSALGSGMQVGDYGSSSNGNGLAVFSDTNGNFLLGSIAGGATFLSIDFGNDDPGWAVAGDLATLKVYSGATLLNTVTMALNLDDIMNQSISYSGAFDNFSFAYTNSAGSPFTGGAGVNTGLTEVVDNITYTAAESAVPEPGTWLTMIAGLGMVAGAMRRRKQNTQVRFAF